MIFYGDIHPGMIFTSRAIIPDMTAIARIYTLEGFTVAADGLGIGSALNRVNENAVKLFSVTDSDKALAYSMTGTVLFQRDEPPNEVLFDLAKELEAAVRTVDTSQAKTLSDFAQMICSHVENRLRTQIDGADSDAYPTNQPLGAGRFVIATIFFDGYYRGIPSQLTATFLHENEKLLPTFMQPALALANIMQGSGSQVMSNLLFGREKGWFEAYRVIPMDPNNVTLAEAIAQVTGYVAACSDPRALLHDKDVCSGIGGHAHVATITKTSGFQWVTAPKNLASLLTG